MARKHFCEKRPGFKAGDDPWALGSVDSCPYHGARKPLGVGPMVNIHRLKMQNREGWTDREFARDIFDAAKRDGRDIERVR